MELKKRYYSACNLILSVETEARRVWIRRTGSRMKRVHHVQPSMFQPSRNLVHNGTGPLHAWPRIFFTALDAWYWGVVRVRVSHLDEFGLKALGVGDLNLDSSAPILVLGYHCACGDPWGCLGLHAKNKIAGRIIPFLVLRV